MPAAGGPARRAFTVLVASEWRRRRPTYALLCGVFVAATAAIALILGGVQGVLAGVGVEIQETLTSEHRIVLGDPMNLGGARVFAGGDGAAERLREASGATVVPRIEVQGVLLHAARYEEFDSGILVGIDPQRDALVARVPDRVDAGRWIDAENAWIEGEPYPQLVVGDDMLAALEMRVWTGGPVEPAHLLNVTAGRFSTEAGEARPVVRTGIVVGTFHTGFNPIDRRTVYLHIDAARALLRAQFDDSAANVLLATGGDADALATAARSESFDVASASQFREHYLSAVLVPVRAFATLVTLVVLGVSGGWVAHVVAQAVLSERRRVAVLRALGLPTRLLVAPPAALLVGGALVGVVAGLLLAALASSVIRLADARIAGLGAAISLPPATVGLIALAILATATLAAGAALAAIQRVSPLEALRD